MFIKNFTRVECSSCGGVYSLFNTIDDDHYDVQFCSLCGEESVETYEETASAED